MFRRPSLSEESVRCAHPALLVVLGWLFPGAGFLLLGRRYRIRALLLSLAIHLTFLLGILLQGGVIWPVWSMNQEGFTIVSNLTFAIQMAGGWMALLSLLAQLTGWTALAASEPHAWFEIGSFYCLVAGAMNYFVVMNSLDRNQKKAFELLARE